MLASRDGKIVCENTLDARLDVVFRKKLPEVNSYFFPRYLALYTQLSVNWKFHLYAICCIHLIWACVSKIDCEQQPY